MDSSLSTKPKLKETILDRADRNKLIIKILLFVVCVCVVGVFTVNDYFLYDKPIGKITKVTNTYSETKDGYDGTYSYNEKYYDQTITATIMNGKYKGKIVTLTNEYGKSEVYDTKYSKGDRVFIEQIKHASKSGAGAAAATTSKSGAGAAAASTSKSGAALTGNISGTKRDWLVAIVLTILFGLFLLVGGKKGALTILSLVLNMGAFYVVLLLYTKGINILAMTIPMTIFFTAMLLFFMHGRSEKTMLSFVATIITILATTAIAAIVIHFGERIDYDFMDYLNQPYDQDDANLIFISEILVGCLGAVMDVVVTMVMTVDQITETGMDVTRRNYIDSCRAVGDDLVGTMINLMLFTNIAACIPRFVLFMRNGIAFTTILKYNVFFEVARFLTGSIGVVLAIPVSAAVAIWYYRKKVAKC
ncbi:YibE/F family protein [Aminicella lysinilytica]|uniref:Putative membrane protein n=1 Tax=Aminicella lysinilytica TaxID=433323 RepID=A0A4R6Q838_9FIRM|nr:YibE/F family protein [Aminicella lysinilytica]TDP58411.1 putative membrane protein [Aminicella lysinilytica]